MKIEEQLKALRLEKGMTTREFAEVVGSPQSAITRYEMGRQNISGNKAQEWAALFGYEFRLVKKKEKE